MSPSTATTWVIRVAACSFISLLLWQLKGSPKVDDLHMSYPNHSLKAAHMQDVADVEESLIETNYRSAFRFLPLTRQYAVADVLPRPSTA